MEFVAIFMETRCDPADFNNVKKPYIASRILTFCGFGNLPSKNRTNRNDHFAVSDNQTDN